MANILKQKIFYNNSFEKSFTKTAQTCTYEEYDYKNSGDNNTISAETKTDCSFEFTNNLKNKKHYYCKGSINVETLFKRLVSEEENEVDIKIILIQETGGTKISTQYITTYTLIDNSSKTFDFDFSFVPYLETGRILFYINKEQDENIGNYINSFNCYEIKDGLDILNGDGLRISKLSVMSTLKEAYGGVMSKLLINGELMTTSQSGLFEISNKLIDIESFAIIQMQPNTMASVNYIVDDGN